MTVPSWKVTNEQLASWGFPVERTSKMMGTVIIEVPGMRRERAVMAAWKAGHVHIESSPTASMFGGTSATAARKLGLLAPKRVPDPAVLAWAFDHRITDPKEL